MSAARLRDRLGIIGISEAAIRNWRVLLLAVVGLLVLATMSWVNIPRLEDPLIEPPRITVNVPYPGASAEDVEKLVMQPIEDELFGMEGVEYIDAKAYPNQAAFVMRFVANTPMDSMTETVRGKILGKRKDLPPEVQEPIVYRAKISTFMSNMVLMVTGDRADAVLTETANRLKDDLVTLPGVATVTLRGAQTKAVKIRVDPTLLSANKVSIDKVKDAIKLANVRVPGGEVHVGAQATLLSIKHELKDSAAVARIPIGVSNDPAGGSRTLLLGDVAEIRDDFRTASERMMQDGRPAVGLEVRFRPGENAIAVGKRVHAYLDKERARLPEGTDVKVPHDQPEGIQRSLSNFIESLVEGVVLVAIVLTLGMGWRSAIVVAIVLPLAMGGAIVGLYCMGLALEQMSIAGLIVALGLLVDDAVVVAESIQVMRDRGLSALRAAVLGTARVFWANNGTTAVACASFLPLFCLSGDVGQFIRGLPIAVILSLVTSLLVAQLLTPWIAIFFLRPTKATSPVPDSAPFDRKNDSLDEHQETNPALRAMKAAYAWSIPKVTAHPVLVILGATAMLVGSLLLLPKVGIQFFPKADKPMLFVAVELPRGADESTTSRKITEVVTKLAKTPEVESTSAALGIGYPNIFVGQPLHPPNKSFGHVRVQLREAASSAIAARLRASLAEIPGARITVEELYTGPPVTHPVVVRLQGEDYDVLASYANEIKARLREIPGTLNVSDSMSDSIPIANFEIDDDRAAHLGVSAGQIGGAIRSIYGEDKLTSFRSGRDTVEVVLEGAETARGAIDDVNETTVTGKDGKRVPVLAMGEVTMGRGVAELTHRDTRHVIDVTADVAGKTLPSNVLGRLRPGLNAMTWKRGYGYSFQGEQAETETGFRTLALAAVATLLIVFVLMVLMFRSLRLSAIVLLAVPYVFIGAIPGLYLTGNAFGFMAFLGVVALVGVYVNHKIYFVDRMNELITRGMDWRSAIRQAGIDRLRPVVLTALTAILGLLPLTLFGGSIWSSFGWVNVFGLTVSIPLSLILLPAFLTLSLRSSHRTALAADDGDDDAVTLLAVDRFESGSRPAATVVQLRPRAQGARSDGNRRY